MSCRTQVSRGAREEMKTIIGFQECESSGLLTSLGARIKEGHTSLYEQVGCEPPEQSSITQLERCSERKSAYRLPRVESTWWAKSGSIDRYRFCRI